MDCLMNNYQYMLLHAEQTSTEVKAKHRWYHSEHCWNCEQTNGKRHGKKRA